MEKIKESERSRRSSHIRAGARVYVRRWRVARRRIVLPRRVSAAAAWSGQGTDLHRRVVHGEVAEGRAEVAVELCARVSGPLAG
jgi:hypothetical protein